jgi:hypothetical protein
MAAPAVAEPFRVSVSYIYKALIRRRHTGQGSPARAAITGRASFRRRRKPRWRRILRLIPT